MIPFEGKSGSRDSFKKNRRTLAKVAVSDQVRRMDTPLSDCTIEEQRGTLAHYRKLTIHQGQVYEWLERFKAVKSTCIGRYYFTDKKVV